MRYLVTGAGGFIGSQLAKKLISNGHDVLTIDNLSTGYEKNIPNQAEFICGNCQDQGVIEKLGNDKFDAIFHIAGQSSGEISFDDPVYDLQTNTQSTLLLLQFARKTGCPKFIYASTMSVYGDHEDLPVTEQHETRPKSFYAVGKLASEQYLRLWAGYGMATAALRLFNVYGPGQNLENMRQGMVSIFLSQALSDGRIGVKGSKDRFRDFVFIDDVVDAFISVEDKIETGKYIALNVSSNRKTTVAEVVNGILEGIESNIPIAYAGGTPGDQFGIFGDNKSIKAFCEWEPKVSFNDGLTKMIDWAKKEKQK